VALATFWTAPQKWDRWTASCSLTKHDKNLVLANLTLYFWSLCENTRMIKRWIIPHLEQALEHYPAVALLGPRQVGKTTLAHVIAKKHSSLYWDLESPEDRL